MILGTRQFASRRPRTRYASMVSPSKVHPSAGTGPQFVLWSHVPEEGSRAYSLPRVLVRARCGVSSQFFRPSGAKAVPAEYSTDNYMSGAYNARNANTDLPDLSEAQKSERRRAVARWIARAFAEHQHRQGLIKGMGYLRDGAAGGCLDFGEICSSWFGNGAGAAIARHVAPLLFHPLDAVSKSAVVNTAGGGGGQRTITLPNRTIDAQLPTGYTTRNASTVAALEALTFAQRQDAADGRGVRHTGYASLWNKNGIAEAALFFDELAAALLEELSAHRPTGDSRVYELCEPAIVLPSLEQQAFKSAGPLGSFLREADGFAQDQYEQVGNFFNARVDPRFGTEAIYYTRDARGNYTVPVTLRDAMLADADLAPLVTLNAPTLTGNVSPTLAQFRAFDRLNYNAMAFALRAAMQPLFDAFPEMKDANYGFVRVPNKATPYVTVGGGLTSMQDVLPQRMQGPSLYGRVGDVAAIRAAATQSELDAAVAAWDAANLDDCEAVLDTIDDDVETLPYIYGVEDPAKVRSGQVGAFGGSAAFFAALAERCWLRGHSTIAVFGGETDRTVAAIEAACAAKGWR